MTTDRNDDLRDEISERIQDADIRLKKRTVYRLERVEATGWTPNGVPYFHATDDTTVREPGYWADWYFSATHRRNVSDALEDAGYSRHFDLAGVAFHDHEGDRVVVRTRCGTEVGIPAERAVIGGATVRRTAPENADE